MNQTSIFSKAQIVQFVAAFKMKANQKQVTAEDIVLYNWVRGLSLKRGFTPITNKVKLANGAEAESSFTHSLFLVKHELAKNTTKNPRVKIIKNLALSWSERIKPENQERVAIPMEGLSAVLNPTSEQCDMAQLLVE